MYLVDTTVWIDFLRGNATQAVAMLRDLLGHPQSYGICDQILMELLQGTRDERGFTTLAEYLGGQPFYELVDSRQSHIDAAAIYARCHRRGSTIRSTFDCLIAQCAVEHNLTLLHQDRDFLEMAAVVPDLKQHHFLHLRGWAG